MTPEDPQESQEAVDESVPHGSVVNSLLEMQARLRGEPAPAEDMVPELVAEAPAEPEAVEELQPVEAIEPAPEPEPVVEPEPEPRPMFEPEPVRAYEPDPDPVVEPPLSRPEPQQEPERSPMMPDWEPEPIRARDDEPDVLLVLDAETQRITIGADDAEARIDALRMRLRSLEQEINAYAEAVASSRVGGREQSFDG